MAAFYWWRRKLAGSDGLSAGGRRPAASSEAAGVFREVRMTPAEGLPDPGRTTDAACYEVVLAGGRRVRIGREFDPQVLSRLIAALEDMPGALPC